MTDKEKEVFLILKGYTFLNLSFDNRPIIYWISPINQMPLPFKNAYDEAVND